MKPTRTANQAASATTRNAARARPQVVGRFSQLVSGECKDLAKKYGDCVNAQYQEVEKDMCKSEFVAFKECAQKVFRCFVKLAGTAANRSALEREDQYSVLRPHLLWRFI
ncbi:hypothetical protein CROQUDRAFT_718021 [Cronartium quercuum f. sp. fusiforme G11]|uniref:Uncharacterized protein n=1 Tax=Cronartium quercuum f. sp. fusiforme G11 TaxID=708437 RepID=A0A9P6N9G2_9BASI|nr:hypothetical protein CROQUDRAFT_718021 [Cronartium quercuum f. sp. fusiforme G11]